VEQIGRPLELDTDGIWCILPSSFPEGFTFRHKDGSGKVKIDYPCAMLNADVHANYTNHQYQDQVGPKRFDRHSECSIYFELDGPYKVYHPPYSKITASMRPGYQQYPPLTPNAEYTHTYTHQGHDSAC